MMGNKSISPGNFQKKKKERKSSRFDSSPRSAGKQELKNKKIEKQKKQKGEMIDEQTEQNKHRKHL